MTRRVLSAVVLAGIAGAAALATIPQQQVEAAKLDAAIAANLKELGYGGN